MELTNIKLEKRDHIAILTLNHPPVNTFNLAMIDDMQFAIEDLEQDHETRVVIITGGGSKGFSAGFDVTDAANSDVIAIKGTNLWTRIENFPKPVIACINGFAFGAGCELALCCHFRYMEDRPKALIGLPELNLGMFPVWGGTQRMPRLVGKSRALDLILLSKKITPARALEIGLVDHVSAEGKVLDDCLELANQLAQRPPLAVTSTLKSINVGLDQGLAAGLQTEQDEIEIIKQTKDVQEGFLAFLEKRPPVFKGE